MRATPAPTCWSLSTHALPVYSLLALPARRKQPRKQPRNRLRPRHALEGFDALRELLGASRSGPQEHTGAHRSTRKHTGPPTSSVGFSCGAGPTAPHRPRLHNGHDAPWNQSPTVDSLDSLDAWLQPFPSLFPPSPPASHQEASASEAGAMDRSGNSGHSRLARAGAARAIMCIMCCRAAGNHRADIKRNTGCSPRSTLYSKRLTL
mgnify:CR=1 FL=1